MDTNVFPSSNPFYITTLPLPRKIPSREYREMVEYMDSHEFSISSKNIGSGVLKQPIK